MSTAYSSKGTKVCVLKGSATATSLTPTAISKAAPAVVTVASVTGLTVGDLVKFPDTTEVGYAGFSELAGKTYAISKITAVGNTFELAGADTKASTGTLAATPSISQYPSATSMLCLCLSSLAFNPESANSISTATFCDPSASIASQVVGAGTIDIGGFVDIADAGYKELIAAEADGKSRSWRITLGNNQGYILFDGVLSALSLDIPLDGAIAFNGTVALSSKYRHLF